MHARQKHFSHEDESHTTPLIHRLLCPSWMPHTWHGLRSERDESRSAGARTAKAHAVSRLGTSFMDGAASAAWAAPASAEVGRATGCLAGYGGVELMALDRAR